MGNPLQQRCTPQELAASGQVIEIKAKVSDFSRLADAIAADLSALEPATIPAGWREASVTGRLSFGFTAAKGNMPAVAGQAGVTIAAVCQRCLRPMTLPLQIELRHRFAGIGEGWTAGGEVDDYELWELSEGAFSPADFVDEALIMALPFAALHAADEQCVATPTVEGIAGEMRTPFADLKSQMANAGKEN